ncbi:hypothetical protein M422DRAFT_25394 [Sphaerobolus stellatus SS14]|nr:hypothetical protein M422DRAFT_25394 [Sphaerobolus stellatus SS14]
MNVMQAPVVVDDVDDQYSCYSYDSAYESVYLSFCESLGRSQSPVQPVAAPTVATSPLSGILEPDPVAIKDQRCYEHATQRLKKPDDLSKARRCVRCRMCRPWKWAGNAGRPKKTDRVLRGDFSEAKQSALLSLEDSIHSLKDQPLTAQAPRTIIVSLGDLMKPSQKRTDNRFEFVKRPRQVLALDDFTEIDSNKYDEDDWEHIELNQQQHKPTSPPRLSYARVVASKA